LVKSLKSIIIVAACYYGNVMVWTGLVNGPASRAVSVETEIECKLARQGRAEVTAGAALYLDDVTA